MLSNEQVGWLQGWQFRKQHLIEGSLAGAEADYQMKIIAYHGSGIDYNDNSKTPPEGYMYLGESESQDQSLWEISVDPNIHENYGFTYPLTYVFNLKQGTDLPKVYYRFSYEQNWSQLPEKTADDFFNGINAVRFSQTENEAYVSIAFSDMSSKIYLNFTDVQGRSVAVSYSRIAEYYDNRKAVVVLTADDLAAAYDSYFNAVCEATRARNIWLTAAIITGSANWTDIQGELDAGYIEPACHSYDHPHIPYQDYYLQVAAAKKQILGNLTLPPLNRKGLKQYVWAWIEPYGESDDSCRAELANSLYLCDRDTSLADVFANWDSINGLYGRIGGSTWGEWNITPEEADAKFDQVYNSGGIYHMMFHPWEVNMTYLLRHLDYIKQRKDIWYAGFGHLYLYHFAQERNLISVSPLHGLIARADFGDLRFTDSDGVTLLDFWMETEVAGDYAVFWVKVPSIPSSPNNATIYVYYGKNDATTTSNGDRTFQFFDHFEGNSLNISKWWASSSIKYSVKDSQLNISDVNVFGGFLAIDYTLIHSGFEIECKNVYYENVPNGAVELLAHLMDDKGNWAIFEGFGDYWSDNMSTAAYQFRIDQTGTATLWNDLRSPSIHDFKIQKDQENNTRLLVDNLSVLGPVKSSTTISRFFISLYKVSGLNCSKTAIDSVIMRKYCSPEPLHGDWVATMTETKISVTAKASSSLIGLRVDIDGTLADISGNGLDGEAVDISYAYQGNSQWAFLARCSTNINGSYQVVWLPSTTGQYVVRAEWAGNSIFSGASNSTALTIMPFQEKYVFAVTSNSTISDLVFNSTNLELSFTTSGPSGTMGYGLVTISKALVENITNLRVYLDGKPLESFITSTNDSWIVSFTYSHSTHHVTIVFNANVASITSSNTSLLFWIFTFFFALLLCIVWRALRPLKVLQRATYKQI